MGLISVFKFGLAYHVVSQSYGLNDQLSSGDDSDASDLEVMDVSIIILNPNIKIRQKCS